MFTTSARLYHDDVNASRGKLERGSRTNVEQPVSCLRSLLILFALPVMEAVCTEASMWLAHCIVRYGVFTARPYSILDVLVCR